MASVILCGTPAVVCDENAPTSVSSITLSGLVPPQTFTGAVNLTTSGDAVLSVAGPQTININVPTPPTPIAQTPTFPDWGAVIGLGAQNSFADGTSIEIPLTWGGTLAGILDPTNPAPPVGSGVYLDLAGFGFYVPVGGNGPISAQLTDTAAIDYPVLQPISQVDTAVGASTCGVGSVLIDANGLHASGMPVAANAVYLRITNGTGQTINLVSFPAEIQTIYYPSVAP